ncbi:MAG: cytidine/deoxycytidylate deaminase family protein [Patescibacteria group bacterium]|nr:cytidine/deoxycytidylate deaminase family protein [Patescibacteria group bacterium]
MKKINKPDWDEYFMKIAEVVKSRADCLRRQVGAVIVKDLHILTTGYNGTPHGIKNCTEGGCWRCLMRHQGKLKSGEKKEFCVCLHAEQNAIIQAAYLGVSTKGAILYSTANPCSTCTKMIINAGIVKVVCKKERHDEEGTGLLKKAGIKIIINK